MGISKLDAHTWSGLEYLESVSGPGAIAELVESYVKDAPARLDGMRAALEARDRARLGRLAHDLKSNSAAIGAMDLARLAERIEHEAETAALEHLGSWMEEADTLLPDVFEALEDRCKRYPG